ncbi:ATP-binding protein [Levilactobacillus enshiensis]|uniref:ATP-binding protein n=1 Tax=Levilactobacillus enshiensis TaxID=2590213 RepID=UPI00117AB01D|nr:ATP-binding protein [Levilactobacillus enshiensis]
MKTLKKQLPFWVIVIAVMTLTIGVAVATTAVLIHQDTVAESKRATQTRILKVAQSTAKMAPVKRVIRASNAGATTNLQTFVKPLVKRDDVDFIVILNHDLIRLSHPLDKDVGHHFSSLQDPRPALQGRIHYSQRPGVLGPEYRVFHPVYDHGKVIGVVCVGVTEKNLNQQLQRKTRPILIGGLSGLLVGLVLSVLLGMYLRYLLLGMEPSEIAERTAQQTLVDDALPEGVIAINRRGQIISVNRTARTLFAQELFRGQPLPPALRELLFTGVTTSSGVEVTYLDKQLLISTNALWVRGKQLGQVCLIRDMSEITGLINKLAGTEHYVSSLRAQTHEFMNQLQVINGLLELEEYPRALEFVGQITDNYHQDIGYVTDKIKWPAMVGLILGKSKEAKEQGIAFKVTATSSVPQADFDSQVEVLLLRIVSNLLDNARDAIKHPNKGSLISLTLVSTATQLKIVVRDTGSGIAPAVREQMFTQGFSTKGHQRGYGMGIIRAAVTRLHGHLKITANQPVGTVMTVVVETKEALK